jgi:hypothetical protein
MDRPRILRLLRIAFSAACGIVCLLLIALWVRSYQRCDLISHYDGAGTNRTLGSNNGYAYFMHTDLTGVLMSQSFQRRGWLIGDTDVTDIPAKFGWESTKYQTTIRVPYIYILPVIGVATGIPWLPWSKRFSLRTLLIATTLVAVVLGLAVAFR